MDLKSSIEEYLKNQMRISDTVFLSEIVDDADEDQSDDKPNIEEVIVEEPVSQTEEKSTEPAEDMILNDNWKTSMNLDDLYDNIHTCLQCDLGKTRTNFVFGSGNKDADIMVIGEAPGKDEDEKGLPFVGRAGQLLTKIIESIDLKREDVYIANICKCRPPNNRAPLRDEVDKCIPFLHKQIEIIKPAFILALGATAVNSLTGEKPIMAEARGKLTEFHGVKMLITYHPAALLYNPNLKRDVWEDMKLLKKLYLEYKQK